MLALARAIDDAAHDGHAQLLHTGVAGTPDGHLRAQKRVDALGQFLKKGAGGAAAARAGGDAGREGAQAQSLQDFQRHHHFLAARRIRLGGERHADGVADALLQQHSQRRSRGHRAFGAHAGLGQAEMQGIVATRRQGAVHRDEILHIGNLARQQDLRRIHPQFTSTLSRFQRREHQRLRHDLARLIRLGAAGIGVHQAGEQFLIETAPVHPDAHGFVVSLGDVDHLTELLVFLVALAHIARVDAVLGQRAGAIGKVGQQPMAVVMKVADERHRNAHAVELLADGRHSRCSLGRVHRDAHQFRARHRKLLDLNGCADRVGRIGIGHGLHAHRRVTAHGHHMIAPDHASLTRAVAGGHGFGNGRVEQFHE